MKSYLHILLMVCIALVMSQTTVHAQCDDEDFLDGCAALLGEYVFIKSFNVPGVKKEDETTEFSYVFSKGTNYMVTVCDENPDGKKLIVELYDRNRRLVASSYSRRHRKHFPKIVYPCQATGVYYLKYFYEGGKTDCGVSILGFKK